MKTSLLERMLLTTALMLGTGHATAEDIDIYQAVSNNAKSNLLVMIENSGAWNANASTAGCPAGVLDPTMVNTAGGVETCGLWRAVDIIGNTSALNDKLNMGLMLFSNGSTNGGTFHFPAPSPAPSALPSMNAAGISAMKTVLQSVKRGGSGVGGLTANNPDNAGLMQEAWAFYTGDQNIGGGSGTKYPGVNASDCGKNFAIFVGISTNASKFNDAVTKLGLTNATTEQLKQITWLGATKYIPSLADEWARYMDQNNGITTYTITLVDPSGNNPDYERMTKSMAEISGGKAFVVNMDDMDGFVQALLKIFNEIQAVNSVFAAASLPISVNAQGTFLNQIYFGMFRPDENGLPRWAGNLKQYQFKLDDTDQLNLKLTLADSQGNSAVSAAGTGFFSPNAVSFWTSKNTVTLPDSIDPTGALNVNGGIAGGFFINRPQGAGAGFDLPDGEIVEKGGVAQRIRLENLNNNYAATAGSSTNPRRMYTCTSGAGSTPDCVANSALSATPFSPANNDITDTLLGTGGGPVGISSLTRNDTTATVVTAAPISPTLQNGQIVTLTGTASPQWNGPVAAGGPPTTNATSTTFTFPVNVGPPTTATGGGFTASTPGFAAPRAATVVREGAFAKVNLASHGFSVGEIIRVIATGTAFDRTIAVAATPAPDANNFYYPLNITPSAAGSGGTATVGTTSKNISGIALSSINANFPYNAVVMVSLTTSHTFAAGSTVTIEVVASPNSAYNQTYSGQLVLGTGNGGTCPAGNPSNKTFCVSINTQPGTAAPLAATVAKPGFVYSLVGLTRGTSCTGATPVNTAIATATTATPHSFVVGDSVQVGGGDAASTAYTSTRIVLASPPPTANTFSYNLTSNLPCSDTSGSKQAQIGGASKTTLINWVRGESSIGDESGPPGAINLRPSIHGDVLHSRPAVINYAGTTGVVVYYGANDGTFRAINGNQTAAIGGVPPGGELWSFIPTEFYKPLLRQYLNTPVVKLEGALSSILPTPQPKDYYFDGNVGVYQDITNNKTVIFLTARRGGRLIYALDVSDPTTPIFLWKRTNADTGFSELGQTWSTPNVAIVKGYLDGFGAPKPVLIFGAGYDSAEDAEPPAGRTMGRGIFILDALTGNIIWQAKGGGSSNTCTGNPCLLADMTYPIPSDVTILDHDSSDGNGYIDRLYVPDLGGNIWRVDLQPAAGNAPANWQVTKFASVGGAVTDTTKRKIFFPPDVVITSGFDAVMFATGDREHPTQSQAAANIINRFYMLKDLRTGNDACSPACSATIADNSSSTANTAPTGLFNVSNTLPTSASSTPYTPGPAYDMSGNGFYFSLINAVAKKQNDGSILYGPGVEKGEKNVNAPTTIGGTTFFGTNSPIAPADAALTCQPNLGTARGYGINFVTGQSKFVVFAGGGLPPSPVSGLVTINGQTVPFLIGAGNPDPGCTGPDCKSSVGGQRPPIPIAPVRSRTYWYRDLGNR